MSLSSAHSFSSNIAKFLRTVFFCRTALATASVKLPERKGTPYSEQAFSSLKPVAVTSNPSAPSPPGFMNSPP